MVLDLASATVKFTYFDLGSLGRGEILRVFFEDAGIKYVDDRVPLDASWGPRKQQIIASGQSIPGHLPLMEAGGKFYHHIHPTLRYFSKVLGKYNASTAEGEYWVDQIADDAIDWLTLWVNTVLGADPAFNKKYAETIVPTNMEIFEKYANVVAGPFMNGHEITYCDFTVYQLLHLNGDDLPGKLDAYPGLKRFAAAFAGRPLIAAYFASERRK